MKQLAAVALAAWITAFGIIVASTLFVLALKALAWAVRVTF